MFFLDIFPPFGYNVHNFIGQFVTILSVNKTRELGWAQYAPIFWMGACCAHFSFYGDDLMSKKIRLLVYGALIAALYAALTHLQNLLLPGSATWAIQFRASEALCVLAFFTPAAIPGLAVGCLVFNLTYAAALPLDFLVGTLATVLTAAAMWLTRKVTIKGFPALGLMMPALFNAVLVGWELTAYIGGGFLLNAVYVAIGEAAVLLSLGTILYYALKARRLDTRLFA